MTEQLVIFAKYPIPGTVKTRLAAQIGAEPAAKLYSRFIEHILDTMTRRRIAEKVVVAVTPPDSVNRFARRFPGADRYEAQLPDDDLGKRMLAVFQEASNMHVKKTVIIGTDSPTLPANYVLEAFSMLESHDVVLGPAKDGGYYLIGAKKPHPELFEDIPWSTARVLEKTIAALDRLRLRYVLLPEYFDVDEIADLHQLYRMAPEIFSGLEMPSHLSFSL